MIGAIALVALVGQAPVVDGAPPAAAPSATQNDPGARKETLRVAVMELGGEGVPAALVRTLTGIITETLDGLGPFKTLSSADIQSMLEYEAEKQNLGCTDASCLAEIVGALGADYLITGTVTRLGEPYLVQLQLFDVNGAKVEARESREHSGPPSGLVDVVAGASRALVRSLLEARSGTLVLSTNEEGATVVIDGRALGVTPLPPTSLAGGTHRVELEKEGFITSAVDVDIEADRPSSISLPLVPSAEYRASYQRTAWLITGLGFAGLGLGGAGVVTGAGVLAGALLYANVVVTPQVNQYNASTTRAAATYEELQGQMRLLSALEIAGVTAGLLGLGLAGAGAVTWALAPNPGRFED